MAKDFPLVGGISRIIVSGGNPISFFAAFFTLPVWEFVESRFHIESVGHSGPSEWVFELLWGLAGAIMEGIVIYKSVAKPRS